MESFAAAHSIAYLHELAPIFRRRRWEHLRVSPNRLKIPGNGRRVRGRQGVAHAAYAPPTMQSLSFRGLPSGRRGFPITALSR